IDFQYTLFNFIDEGIRQRGGDLTPGMRDWASELAEKLIQPLAVKEMEWHSMPVKGNDSNDPWSLQKRKSQDGKQFQFISSLPGGEKSTGVLRSRAFAVPPELSFFMAGHDGPPDKELLGKNFVRLRESATDVILTNEPPPRNDTAELITWDLKEHAGKEA